MAFCEKETFFINYQNEYSIKIKSNAIRTREFKILYLDKKCGCIIFLGKIHE